MVGSSLLHEHPLQLQGGLIRPRKVLSKTTARVLDQAVGVAEDAWLDAAQRAILCLSGEEKLLRLLTLSAVFKV